MKKKLLAIFVAASVMVMNSLTVFAESPTTTTTEKTNENQKATTTVEKTESAAEYAAETKASEGFTVTPVSEAVVESSVVATQNMLLNNLAITAQAMGNPEIAAAATDSTKKVTADVLSCTDVSPTSAKKDANGNYVVTLSLPNVAAGDAIAILHYTGAKWEFINPAAVGNGTVTFGTKSLSPIVVVKLEISGLTTSPQTGSEMPVALFVLVAGIAGAVVCGKKYFA